MSYLAFDMDGTLGDFSILKQLLCIFNQPSYFLKSPDLAAPPNKELDDLLVTAYAHFIHRLIEAELSEKPLGIFRPGIFQTFSGINALKSEGRVKAVVIYSNNHQESLVQFVRDVINTAVKAPVVDSVFFRYHKHRTVENPAISNPEKTWGELHNLLTKSGLAPDTVTPKEVMFFDDLIHTDLKKTLTKTNYFQVAEYSYNPPLLDLLEVYRKALIEDSKELEPFIPALMVYIKNCSYGETSDLTAYINSILTAKVKGDYSVKGKGPVPKNKEKSAAYILNSVTKRGGKRKNKTKKLH